MTTKLETFNKKQLRKDLPEIRPGDLVRVYQKIKEKKGERVQPFEGIVIAKKHGKGISSTITVRGIISGIGVEKIFPLHSPTIEKIEIKKRGKTRRAKLYYLRKATGRKARLKRVELADKISLKETTEVSVPEETPKTEETSKEEMPKEEGPQPTNKEVEKEGQKTESEKEESETTKETQENKEK